MFQINVRANAIADYLRVAIACNRVLLLTAEDDLDPDVCLQHLPEAFHAREMWLAAWRLQASASLPVRQVLRLKNRPLWQELEALEAGVDERSRRRHRAQDIAAHLA